MSMIRRMAERRKALCKPSRVANDWTVEAGLIEGAENAWMGGDVVKGFTR